MNEEYKTVAISFMIAFGFAALVFLAITLGLDKDHLNLELYKSPAIGFAMISTLFGLSILPNMIKERIRKKNKIIIKFFKKKGD